MTPPDFQKIAKEITDEAWRAYGPTQTMRIAVALAEAWLAGVEHGKTLVEVAK